MAAEFNATPHNVLTVVNAWFPRYYRERPDAVRGMTAHWVRRPGLNCVGKAALGCVLFEIGGLESQFGFNPEPDRAAFKTLHPIKKPFTQPLRHAWTAREHPKLGTQLQLEVTNTPEFKARIRPVSPEAISLPLQEGLDCYFDLQYGRTAPSAEQLLDLTVARLRREQQLGMLELVE